MKKKINYRDKIIWDNCEELYDKIFKYKIKEDYNFYKSSFCKVMTIKLGNSKTFLELLKEKKNSKKIFYFRRNDEFQVSKLYAEKKNIVVKKYKLNYSILIYKIVNFFLENLTYENNYKKNTILFVRNRTKYQKIFDMCASTMNKKYNFIYYNNILKILTSHKLKFQAKKKTDLEKKLLISNLEGIYGILIIKKLLNNYLSEIKPKAIISVEGDSLEHSVMAYISKNKYKTYCFQWGSFVKKNDIKNGFKYMYQDKKFVWGPYYKKKFQEINSDTNFIVAGNSLIKENYNSKKKDIVFLLNPNTPYIDDKTNKDFLQIGSNNGYYFYKFKDLQKKTKVTIYEQGMFVNEDWRTNKPKKFASDKWEFSKEDNIYSYKEEINSTSEVMTYGFAIQKWNNGKYFNTTTFLWKKDDENLIDLVMDQECDEVKKDIFKSLIKNGVN